MLVIARIGFEMFHIGQQLGEYNLIEKLGRGGFGEVWLAENQDELFAIKLPHKDQVDWKEITQEIGLWTLCGKHQNVMPLIGARNFNGQIAIISEYAPDGSLEDFLRQRGKLSVEEAVEITIGILEGLQHLHESGIIHRDLKPANILLDGKTPRLTDFGISRIISADSVSETISGTWAYMAPECFDGKRNIQTDIWAVGVILYRMLAGNLPFPRKEQTALVGSIIMSEPDSLPIEISMIIRKVVLDLLSKCPDKRPSLSSIRFDLENYIDDTKGFLNRLNQRKVLIEERKSQIENNSKELIPYRKGDKWGFCDKNKIILIKPTYDFVRNFIGNLAWVKLGGKRFFIDKTGREVMPLKYDFVGNFSEDLAWVKLNYKWGFINKTGQEIIPLKYDDVGDFNEGLVRVKLNHSWFYIDKTGREIIHPKCDDVGDFREGLARVELNSNWGFINKTGQEIIPLKYDYADDFREDLALVSLTDMTDKWICDKWIFIDKTGREVIQLNYTDVEDFSQGLAGVMLDNKWGFIDKTGQEVIPLKYDIVKNFNEGLAEVNLNDKWGYIGYDGTEYFED